MTISLIIPAYNEEKNIAACLQSIIVQAPPELIEIIVVDNAGTDRTAEIARTFPRVRVVREPRKGLTVARQCGLKAATGELLAYVDADTRMPPGWFDILQREYADDDRLVCLSGPYDYYDLSRSKKLAVSCYWRCMAWPMYMFTGYMAVGGNFVARRSALEAIGGFDTGIAFYGEDTDIARRLSRIGSVKFRLPFFIYSSGRRLQAEGVLHTACVYGLNFLSEVILRRPWTKEYRDIR